MLFFCEYFVLDIFKSEAISVIVNLIYLLCWLLLWNCDVEHAFKLHAWVFCPLHSVPPFWAWTWIVLVCCPGPQVVLQVPQFDHWQFTRVGVGPVWIGLPSKYEKVRNYNFNSIMGTNNRFWIMIRIFTNFLTNRKTLTTLFHQKNNQNG